ncbi:MAG: site-specific DNA-methyltransferase [Treponema sp.]|nr:site-specific DNA-methyltransferase [Treponema sp.]
MYDSIPDSFMGSGTSTVAVVKAKRNYRGYDSNEKYIKLANNSIKCAYQEAMTLWEPHGNRKIAYVRLVITVEILKVPAGVKPRKLRACQGPGTVTSDNACCGLSSPASQFPF